MMMEKKKKEKKFFKIHSEVVNELNY